MSKTILLASATLLLAVAALVTDLVTPYAGNIDSTGINAPAQVQQIPARAPMRTPAKIEIRELADISSHPAS
ncbi:MAG: hypothetical protein WC670_16475 [Pseudolabrys sp.]|jgi:hypothetical protein